MTEYMKKMIFNAFSDQRFELTDYLASQAEHIMTVDEISEKYDPVTSIVLDENEADKTIRNVEKEILDGNDIRFREDYEGLVEKLDGLCCCCAVNYFGKELFTPGKEYDVDELIFKNRVIDNFRPMFIYMLRMLEDMGYVKFDGNSLKILRSADDVLKPEEFIRSFNDEQKKFMPYAELLMICAESYDEVFRGKKAGNSVLYPEGKYELTNNVEESIPLTTNRYLNEEVLARIAAYISSCKKEGRTLRILEIGAGTGDLTYRLLPLIDSMDNIVYTFTDIGRSFVSSAEYDANKAGRRYMKFAKLDICGEIGNQGFYENSYDMILGYDVIQASPDIAKCLENINKLLVPGGLFMQIQSHGGNYIDNLVYGLAPGWWNFTLDPLRGRKITMTDDEWLKALDDKKFTNLFVLPHKEYHSNCAIYISECNKASDVSDRIFNSDIKEARRRKIASVGAELSYSFIKTFDDDNVRNFLNDNNGFSSDEIMFSDMPLVSKEYEVRFDISPEAAKVISIIEEAISRNGITLDDDLLSIGLDSLSILLVISKVNETFGTDISVSDAY
jgi:SAM-dependent methyltransferase/acyl carrier protein